MLQRTRSETVEVKLQSVGDRGFHHARDLYGKVLDTVGSERFASPYMLEIFPASTDEATWFD